MITQESVWELVRIIKAVQDLRISIWGTDGAHGRTLYHLGTLTNLRRIHVCCRVDHGIELMELESLQALMRLRELRVYYQVLGRIALPKLFSSETAMGNYLELISVTANEIVFMSSLATSRHITQ